MSHMWLLILVVLFVSIGILLYYQNGVTGKGEMGGFAGRSGFNRFTGQGFTRLS